MFRPILIALFLIVAPAMAMASPKAAADQLLAADRAYSDAALKAADPVAGISAMFDGEVIMPTPKGHAIGREAVVAQFRENPSFKEGKVSWVPVRAGISADGTHGFTYGFLSVTGGDPAKRDRKYLAYWIKRPDGWRVVTYRQQVRQAGAVSMTVVEPSLPAFTTEPSADSRHHEQSVAAAEKAFSDLAQQVGLKAAFREYGRADAVNIYPGAGFVVGPDAIADSLGDEGGPAKIHWSTEHAFAAPSGDLAVSIGTIRPNDPKAGLGFAFFTIWRRDGLDQPWRYIAE